MSKYTEKIQEYKQDMLNNIAYLVEVPSIRDLSTKGVGSPFGENIKRAFDRFLEIANKLGFACENDEGYAAHAEIGKGEEYVGVLAHLDVVDVQNIEEWETEPFSMIIKNNKIFGRGVNDDKGPLISALYAAKILNDMNVEWKRKVRIIVGGAEETTWECMEHYFKTHSQPTLGFSPDGNFPIVNGEKGILGMKVSFKGQYMEEEICNIESRNKVNYVCDDLKIVFKTKNVDNILSYSKNATEISLGDNEVTLIYKGKVSLSRNPQRGKNAMFLFVGDFYDFDFKEKGIVNMMNFIKDCLLDDFYGEKMGLYREDKEMGKSSICPMTIKWKNGKGEMSLDYRYPKNIEPSEIKNRIYELAKEYKFDVEIEREKKLLYVPSDSELIMALKEAYKKVMNEEADTITKGGASYARVLKNAVAFGATFDGEEPNPHMPNENMSIDSLMKATEIYCEALYRLACK
ncbi:Sapep family Mn(2+)-dependent dipeptidase [Clostridium amazonitimonense]|uniref:Sapep family Mn(2+)-dependent dipeptidase n=1 Tax=Clostridium amazonitimonense TaxID=1499689 RepID=UPI0005A94061|nr:Sapep family Mn(2+)-dependent dipeptidase [Clostridium amazonitimonense]